VELCRRDRSLALDQARVAAGRTAAALGVTERGSKKLFHDRTAAGLAGDSLTPRS
jgi:hypothetical protein